MQIKRHVTFTDEAWCQQCGNHPIVEFMVIDGGEVSWQPCPHCGSMELSAHVIPLQRLLDTREKHIAAAVLHELVYLFKAEGDAAIIPPGTFSDGVRHK
jgi:hypothetical protein